MKWNFDHPLCGKEKFKTWLKGRIGTVHTFQGKEEEMVLFVLGASVDASGGSIWAARKPNLLNVAVTRAKKQVFLVGCKKVWGKLSHFDTANAQLPTIKVAETAETV